MDGSISEQVLEHLPSLIYTSCKFSLLLVLALSRNPKRWFHVFYDVLMFCVFNVEPGPVRDTAGEKTTKQSL